MPLNCAGMFIVSRNCNHNKIRYGSKHDEARLITPSDMLSCCKECLRFPEFPTAHRSVILLNGANQRACSSGCQADLEGLHHYIG